MRSQQRGQCLAAITLGGEPLADGGLAGPARACRGGRGRRASAASPSARAAGSSGVNQQPAAGRLDQFGERPVSRLHHRHAVGPASRTYSPFGSRYVVGTRQHVDGLQEAHLVGVRRAFDVLEVARRARRRSSCRHLLVEERPVVLAEPAGGSQLRRRRVGLLPQVNERIDQVVEPLLGADAGEVADRERRLGARRRGPPWPARLIPG